MILMQYPPALAIVSFHSGAGKTTLLEGIIRILTRMGYRVCVIKHSAHNEIRDSGKDTFKYREAGAAASTLLQSSGYLEVCSQSADLPLAIDVASRFNPDIVLCEGFKDSGLPKIAVVESSELGLGTQLQGVVAFVLKEDVAPVSGVTSLPHDPSAVAAFIESRFLTPRRKVPLTDRYGRRILGIRMSLTQRCNLNCVYCHHEGEGSPSGEMHTDEVLRILRLARDLGMRRVKFTGGEPLLRRDLGGIIAYSYALGFEDVGVTTNGQLLRERALELHEAGLRRLNLSLPSVDPTVYRSITGGDLRNVVEGLEAARRLGIHVKINTVVMRGINDSSIDTILEFARRHSSQLQLIELEDLHLDKGFFEKYHVDLAQTEQMLSGASDSVVERGEMNRRRVYLVKGLPIEIVRPVSNPNFCTGCTRIRVTSDGKVKPCLMRDDLLFDLLGGIRSGWTDDRLKGLFMSAVSAREPFYR
ncbi:MAG: GTP 3',8-cyclase MoaA [Candidatus Methanosuratus sp.]|nr:GTP 3',8-cyclase MoaA [Candidatus Methanosuratincola sp.]